jgi:sugar lactone lactonase YvrE
MDVLLDGLGFAEGPRWHDDSLFFSDMGTKQVIRLDLDGTAEEVCIVENRPSGIGWLPTGEMVVVSQNDKRLLKLVGTDLVEHADISSLATGACNDMVVDGRGNAYVGNPGYDMRNPPSPLPPAEVVLVRADGSAEVVDREVRFPNGSVVTPDNRTLIVGETMGQRLTAFDIAEDGTLSNRRIWAEGVGPDGICLDADGCVWASSGSMTNDCARIREGGEVLEAIELDRPCFAAMLGGPDRRTLFMLTAQWRGTAAIEDVIKARTGQVLIADAPAPGVGWP